MYMPRACGCKGVRTCLICEEEFGIKKRAQESLGGLAVITTDLSTRVEEENNSNSPKEIIYEYCYLCGKAWKGLNSVLASSSSSHPDHSTTARENGDGLSPSPNSTDPASAPESFDFPGILLVPDFITEEEEAQLVDGCDGMPWDLSQSGRRKQNFGPKTNFKKKKINGNSFSGFPAFSSFIQAKFTNTLPFLADFHTIEQCAIEYRVETGAHIDPHIDDCWVWGERVLSVNLLSDSVLTMNKYSAPAAPSLNRYNLESYYNENNNTCTAATDKLAATATDKELDPGLGLSNRIVRIPMPRRSLLILHGPARYEWEHCVLRTDISARRICLAYREFTKEYLEHGAQYETVGLGILNKAKHFW